MKHLAIIADGNRRWAKKKGIPLKSAYAQSLGVIEQCCDWCLDNQIKYLSIFCFSTENWTRPKKEIDILIKLGIDYLNKKKNWYLNKNVKIKFKGRKDRLDSKLIEQINTLEKETKECSDLLLIICLDYGGQDEIITAFAQGMDTIEKMNDFLTKDAPFPDAMLRTGGECRLSNFMLWQLAYAELFFTNTLFPDLKSEELNSIKQDFVRRKRNYGK